jgi:16S rRNA (cytosine1402-N4)-methyltransferase
MSKKYPPQQLHIPVLLEPVLAFLDPRPGESYLDLTAGFGGHATRVIEKTGAPKRATLVDRDSEAIHSLAPLARHGAILRHEDFASAAAHLVQNGQVFDMALLDLGVSSPQLDNGARGFSFQADAPLDMRMDQQQGVSAKELVNTASVNELTHIIREFGEERPAQAKRIAEAIVAARPIETTAELAAIILKQHRGKWTRIHPATRTFQAVRLAVNDELGQLKTVLPLIPPLLKPGGRIVVISFHSLEDRLVKRFLNEQAQAGFEATLRQLSKKPVAGADYDVHHPRARSAKLRAAVKINTKERKDLDHAYQSS